MKKTPPRSRQKKSSQKPIRGKIREAQDRLAKIRGLLSLKPYLPRVRTERTPSGAIRVIRIPPEKDETLPPLEREIRQDPARRMMAEILLPQIHAAEHTYKKLYREAAERGFETLESAYKGAAARADSCSQRWREWQAEAEKLWRENPKLSKRSVAMILAKRTGKPLETIRQRVKKPR